MNALRFACVWQCLPAIFQHPVKSAPKFQMFVLFVHEAILVVVSFPTKWKQQQTPEYQKKQSDIHYSESPSFFPTGTTSIFRATSITPNRKT